MHLVITTLLVFLAFGVLFFSIILERKPKYLVGDPSFDKRIAESPKFKEPCYVYSDGVESSEIRKKVPIVGYRISQNLVIHEISGKKRADNYAMALKILSDVHGSFLTPSDVEVLSENYQKLNKLRFKVCEPRIPEGYFWMEGKNKKALTDVVDKSPYYQIIFNFDNPSIIAKR